MVLLKDTKCDLLQKGIVNYSETFSPVAKIVSIKVFFSKATNKELSLHQFDVKIPFFTVKSKTKFLCKHIPASQNNFHMIKVADFERPCTDPLSMV